MTDSFSCAALRPGTPMVFQLEAQLGANDLWDVLHRPRPRRRPPVRRPGPQLTNPLARLVRALPSAQFRAWSSFLAEAGISPAAFAADVAGPASFAQVPFGRLLRYRDWLLARGCPDLLAPFQAPPAAAALAQAA